MRAKPVSELAAAGLTPMSPAKSDDKSIKKKTHQDDVWDVLMAELGTVEMPASARTAKLPDKPKGTAAGPRATVLLDTACHVKPAISINLES